MDNDKRIKCKKVQIDCDGLVDDEFCMYAYGVCSQQVAKAPRPQDSSGSAEFALLDAIKAAKTHAERERDKAKDYINSAKSKGNQIEVVAWNHTYLAYDDMLNRLKGI